MVGRWCPFSCAMFVLGRECRSWSCNKGYIYTCNLMAPSICKWLFQLDDCESLRWKNACFTISIHSSTGYLWSSTRSFFFKAITQKTFEVVDQFKIFTKSDFWLCEGWKSQYSFWVLSGEFEGNKFHHPSSKVWLVPSLKLTQQLKRGHPKRKFIFQPLIFRVANRKLTTCRIIHHPCVSQKGHPRISQGFFSSKKNQGVYAPFQLNSSPDLKKLPKRIHRFL